MTGKRKNGAGGEGVKRIAFAFGIGRIEGHTFSGNRRGVTFLCALRHRFLTGESIVKGV